MMIDLILLSLLGPSFAQMYQKVKLKNVDVLTLNQGRMTNGRRSSPVPQLQVISESYYRESRIVA